MGGFPLGLQLLQMSLLLAVVSASRNSLLASQSTTSADVVASSSIETPPRTLGELVDRVVQLNRRSRNLVDDVSPYALQKPLSHQTSSFAGCYGSGKCSLGDFADHLASSAQDSTYFEKNLRTGCLV